MGVEEDGPDSADRNVQEWMLICQNNAQFEDAGLSATEDVDWSLAGDAYPDLHENLSLIGNVRTIRHSHTPQRPILAIFRGSSYGPITSCVSTSSPRKERNPYGWTGKSYLIECLRQLLGDCLRVAAPTGGAAYNVHGHTVYSLVSIPVRGDFKEMEGQRLHTIQESLDSVYYLIVDEISMVGRTMFGKMDRRLRQAFPQR